MLAKSNTMRKLWGRAVTSATLLALIALPSTAFADDVVEWKVDDVSIASPTEEVIVGDSEVAANDDEELAVQSLPSDMDDCFFLFDGKESNDYVAEKNQKVNPVISMYYYDYSDHKADEEGRVVLDASKYTLTIEEMNDEGDYVKVTAPFGIGFYKVTATARSGSGLTGYTITYLSVEDKYDLDNASIYFPDQYYEERVIWASFVSGTKASPTVYLSDDSIVDPREYKIYYTTREKWYADDTNYMSNFPTVPGEYVVLAVGNNSPYTGMAYGRFYVTGSITKASVGAISAQKYTGRAIAPKPIVKYGNKTLKEGEDYTFSYKNNTNAGNATVTIIGKDCFSGSLNKAFVINKASNPLTAKGKKATLQYSKVKKKTQTIAASKVLKVSKAQGKVSYSKASGSKRITVDKKSGKIKVEKGTKKGTYKIKIKISAAGNANYKAGSKAVTCKVIVK